MAPADDVADGDGDEGDWPEQNPLDRADNGAGAGNVQQIDQLVFPLGHGDVVHAVLFGVRGRLPVVGAENMFTEAPIHRGADDQNGQTDNECCHMLSSLKKISGRIPLYEQKINTDVLGKR